MKEHNKNIKKKRQKFQNKYFERYPEKLEEVLKEELKKQKIRTDQALKKKTAESKYIYFKSFLFL